MWGALIGAGASLASGAMQANSAKKLTGSQRRAKDAQEYLLQAARGQAPEAPLQGIAGLDPLQLELYEDARRRFLSPGVSPYQEAMAATRPLMEGGDPTQSDVYQGILSEALRTGTQSNRNVGRALRLSGNAPTASGKGRDILGRNTDQWTQGMAVSLADYVAGEKNRQLQAAGMYGDLAQAGERSGALTRAEAGNAAQMMRAIQQQRADAEYQQAMQYYDWLTRIRPGILTSVIGGAQISPTQPSSLSSFSQGVGNMGNIMAGIQSMGSSIGSLFQGNAGGTGSNVQNQSYMNSLASGPYGN